MQTKGATMQNRDVAHQFFYDLNGSFDRRSMTVSYCRGKYYSYSTVIGQIAETITGKTVLLISDNNFSNTTAKHLNELKAACPYELVYLPQTQGNNCFYPQDVIDKCIRNIKYYSESKLSQKPNREALTSYYNMLLNTLELVGFESQFEKTIKTLDEFENIYQAINDPEKLKTIKELQKKKDKEKQENLKAELKDIIENQAFDDIAAFAYSNLSTLDTEIKNKLKEYLNPKRELSFIWFDAEYVKTSKHITVNRKEVEALLKLWKHNKLKHGMTISYYTVLEVKTDYVKVGCHKIPTENLEALYNKVQEKNSNIGD